jgi:Holliday junction DNA helicase RuvA
MIGRIKGQLVEISENVVLVDVAGVGYELEVTLGVLALLPARDDVVTLYTHLVVREDAQLLYGFASREERDLFRALIRITGVGPKLALNLISSVSLVELASCVQSGEVGVLTRVPGVGRKTAERLLVELKGKLTVVAAGEVGRAVAGAGRSASEAEDALVALGYRPAEASRMIDGVRSEGGSTEDLVRAALRRAARQAEGAA